MSRDEDDDLAASLRALFMEEAGTLLNRADAALNSFGAGLPSAEDDRWRALTHPLHTLKGAAVAVGATRVKDAAHHFEGSITRLRQAGGTPGSAGLDALLAEQERLSAAVDAFTAGAEGAAGQEQHLAPLPGAEPWSGAQAESWGASRAEWAMGAPTERSAAPPKVHAKAEVPTQTQASTGTRIEAPAEATADSPTARPRARTEAGLDVLQVRSERVDALYAQTGELGIARLSQDETTQALSRAAGRLDALERRWRSLSAERRLLRRGGAPLDHLAPAEDALGVELSAASTEINRAAEAVARAQSQTSSMSQTVETGVRELRLMPLRSFFEPFARVVREAARASGRRVRLEIAANEAEIDRAVLLRLRDSIAHLVRNAVAHGIEDPEQRLALGKPELGLVRLEALPHGDRVTLRVRDDGAGIDRVRVREKAERLGLLDRSQELDDATLAALLTHPGFTTRERVDALAGRGIGLDVVAECMRALDGELGLRHAPGEGTTFILDVPITTSTGLGLVLHANGDRLGVMASNVDQVMRVAREDVREVEGRAVVSVGGELVAVVRLAGLWGARPRAALRSRKQAGVVVRAGRRRLVLLVDDIPGEQTLITRPLGVAFDAGGPFRAAALLPDGAVLPMLRVSALFERAQRLRTANAEDLGFVATSDVERASVSVLVVDDSITMRTLERNILTAAGYAVTVAHDGQVALECLARLPECRLVVTDLEMPQLDGAALCQRIRASDRPNLPVLMVSGVEDAVRKQRALDCGADAYVVKGDFEQGRFLELVANLCGKGDGAQ